MKSPFSIRNLARRVLPPGTKRHQTVRRLLDRAKAQRAGSLSYEQWLEAVEPRLPVARATPGPLISIIVPAYNTPDAYLDPLIASLVAQTYPHWELVLVNGSPDKTRSQAIRAAARRDQRIREVSLTTNKGIADTTNVGLAQATGYFIAFMDHDDTLAPFALAEVAAALAKDPAIDLFYSDEDKLSDDGRHRLLPFFKPNWSPELLLNVNYMAHFVVVRAELVAKVKGIRLGYDGAQDYDFLLRLLDHQPKVQAVQRMSYHWRQATGSTGLDLGEKSYATDAGLRALQDYIKRHKIAAAAVEIAGRPTEYRLRYVVRGQPPVYVLATSARDAAAFAALRSRTNYQALHLVHSIDEATDASGLLLHLDVAAVPKAADWLHELVGLAQQPEIGWAGGAVLAADGRSQGIGYAWDGKTWQPLFTRQNMTDWTLMGPAIWPRNILAVSPDCALIELKKLKHLAGIGDDVVGSGLQVHQHGWRNVYWPYAELTSEHALETISGTRGPTGADPYLNTNVMIEGGQPVLRR